ncbi:MAG: multiheme c-type cytochrome [Armatimonadota bacterium]|nr:multiheme c-type cytochrome [Armatimonadota bacterium]
MAFRHTFFLEKKLNRPNTLLLDNGNLADDPRKLSVILQVMASDGYDAVGTGALDRPLAEHLAREATRLKVRLVRALPQGDAVDRVAETLYVKTMRGRRVGVTSLPPPPAGESHDAYLQKAVAALREMRGRCDYLILLSQLGMEADKELARQCGTQGPHLIIGNLEAQSLRVPLPAGNSILLPTGPGGVRVGVAEITLPRLRQPELEMAVVQEGRGESGGHPDVMAIIGAYFAERQKEFLANVDPKLATKSTREGAGDIYRCGRCHKTEARRWSGGRHARAVDTLLRQNRMVPECLVCHTTRYRNTGIFDHSARAGSVDCTGCHVIDAKSGSPCPDKATRTRGVDTCLPCHTAVNSPHFNYPRYLPQVDHTQDPPPLQPGDEEYEEKMGHAVY